MKTCTECGEGFVAANDEQTMCSPCQAEALDEAVDDFDDSWLDEIRRESDDEVCGGEG